VELVENAGVGSGWLRLACDAIADSSGRGHEISEGEDRDQCHAPRWMVRVAKKIFCPERERVAGLGPIQLSRPWAQGLVVQQTVVSIMG